MRLLRWLHSCILSLAVGSIRFYQNGISPLLGARCKYFPSCSNYFLQSLHKHGLILGSLKGCWRILRCNPFSRGGYDPP